MKNPTWLYSIRKCSEQPPHTDNHKPGYTYNRFVKNNTLNKSFPLSAILAVQEGTYIIGWEKSHLLFQQEDNYKGEKLSKKKIQIPLGHILLFRQDFIHAGGSYPTNDNLRLFAYFDQNIMTRQKNATATIDFEKQKWSKFLKIN